ncbi:MAG: hypothetical protein LC749_13465 [Actinobacteria bacterium]|nr:hypothetical protein [Actinomycetota bacterium]
MSHCTPHCCGIRLYYGFEHAAYGGGRPLASISPRRVRPEPRHCARPFGQCSVALGRTSPHSRFRRHRFTAVQYRHEMDTRLATWNEVVGLPTAT